ncbi:hypothetical protein GGX14DRAFT_632310, partial [Mycena pura]
NILYGCVDEVHLINEWGSEFRPPFKHIGRFFRGRLPPSASIFALSGTLQPGSATKSVLSSLGMLGDNFYMFRSSNDYLGLPFQKGSNSVPMTSASKVFLSALTGMKQHREKFAEAVEAVSGEDMIHFLPACSLGGSQGYLSRCRRGRRDNRAVVCQKSALCTDRLDGRDRKLWQPSVCANLRHWWRWWWIFVHRSTQNGSFLA